MLSNRRDPTSLSDNSALSRRVITRARVMGRAATSDYWRKTAVLVLGLAAFALSPASRGAESLLIPTINWGVGARDITADSDVSVLGSLVQATNLGALSVSSATLNGVTFTAAVVTNSELVASVAVGAFTLSETVTFLRASNTMGNADTAPFSNLSAGYKTLLLSAASAEMPLGEASLVLTMPTLTVGKTYLFQWWAQSSEGDYVTASGGLTLNSNTGGTGSSLGQFGIGTFTASAATMSIVFNGTLSSPVINAFQLRDVSAIPEPSTYAALAGLAVLVLAWARRRRQVRNP